MDGGGWRYLSLEDRIELATLLNKFERNNNNDHNEHGRR